MNEQPREAENMAHDSAETSRRLRRRILIVLGCILAVIVLAEAGLIPEFGKPLN